MARIRIQRLEKELTKLISNTILLKLRDKKIQSVTITSVSLTNDMSLLKIYFTHLGKESDKKVLDLDIHSVSGNLVLHAEINDFIPVPPVPVKNPRKAINGITTDASK